MTNQELLQKMKEDMEMRGFSHWTKESYELKAKDTMRYFKKPMEEVTIDELREYLLKYLKEERKLSERSVNYYNSVRNGDGSKFSSKNGCESIYFFVKK